MPLLGSKDLHGGEACRAKVPPFHQGYGDVMPVPEQLDDLPYADVLTRHDGPLEPRGEYDVAHFDEQTFEDAEIGNVQFLECAFTSVTFDGGAYRRARFNDVWLNGARLVGVDMAESAWRDAVALSSALSGVETFGASLRRVTFARCKLDSVNLRASLLEDVTFEDCMLNDLDLGGATLNHVRFRGSTLRGVRLAQAELQDVDFRGTHEFGLADGYDALRGATIDTSQLMEIAPALANVMGITVGDEPQ